ncbi:hypothetical protein [Microbacterium hominis]|uniref:Uncharacterized protein n=1 Tax=Microbacterium hominis TaxID=162426 RepID=A0A7D4TE18_9MICO|nr:hypothetical protein [Microbacterium hominis]QKJ18600.1 hypothetical protein HQM25_03830 [Microbacterium hominis]
MTVPDPYSPAPAADSTAPSPLFRAAIWVAIGALIAAALVCVVWVLVGNQNGIVGRAFLTILLLVGFAGVALLDAHLAPRRPGWFALASMASWIIALLIGAVMIWMPERFPWSGFTRTVQFLLIVLILQLVLLHLRLYTKAFQRYVTPFTQVVAIATIALVVGLAALVIVPLMVGEFFTFAEIYWRIVVAVSILAAVGTALIPLVNALFAPRRERVAAPVPAPDYTSWPPPGAQTAAAAPAIETALEQELLPWPTYYDGVTPLPIMPDGSPDWGAYYTGYPSEGAQVIGMPLPAAEETPADAGLAWEAEQTDPGVRAAEPAAEQPETAPYAEPAVEQPAADPAAQQPEAAPAAEPAPAPAPEPERAQPAPAPPQPPSGYEGYPPPPPLPPRS